MSHHIKKGARSLAPGVFGTIKLLVFVTFLVTAHIVNAYGASTLSIADARVTEGNAGQVNVEVTVILDPDASAPATVRYATRDGSAREPLDYATASGTLTFAKGEYLKTITIAVNGDVTGEADETFEVILSSPVGATLTESTGTVVIVNDDLSGARPGVGRTGSTPPGGVLVPGSTPGTNPTIDPADPRLSAYQVVITFRGNTGFVDQCGSQPNGRAVLSGLLFGNELVEDDSDIQYVGVLQFEGNIDICDTDRKSGTDEDFVCSIKTIGSGPMNVELDLQFDGRGAYIKAETTAKRFKKKIGGTCTTALTNDERSIYPNDSKGNPLNGTEFKYTSRKLRLGRFVDGPITMEVTRVVRQ